MNRATITPASVVNAICEDVVGPALVDIGFTSVGTRRWARDRAALVTDLFEFQALKGAVLSPRWGFSLSFVPSVRAGRLCWHRTLNSVKFDLVDDPVDVLSDAELAAFQVPTLHGPEALRDSCSRVVPLAASSASAFWARVTAASDLLAVCAFLKNRTCHRFDFDNYPQQSLAHAYLLARLGQLELAQDELCRTAVWADAEAPLRNDLQRSMLEAACFSAADSH